ncbi:MAG: SOS response-associated peptidase [Alphaproteobacteria bacterium]|nr:MAG: SOS response-associated peptidase [Alphaproteobacteria bacterium]
MCGRYALTTPIEAVARHFGAVADPFDDPGPRRDIRPTQQVPAVILRDGRRVLTPMRWGFLPHWYDSPSAGPLIINARAEGIADKPAFRKAVRETRCLVPANGFYEWRPGPEPGRERVHWVSPPGEALFAMAGVWRLWQGPGGPLACLAIVTCPANAALRGVHHRMPVVIALQDYGLWLGEAGHGAARLMRPAPEDFFVIEKGRGPGDQPHPRSSSATSDGQSGAV